MLAEKHVLVRAEPATDGGYIAKAVDPTPGLVAQCPECGAVLKGADPRLIVGCPSTGKFAVLAGVDPQS